MNTHSLKISVIIPVYNLKPYLEEGLNSIINQTYQNLEIIIVDDGSTDGSGDICNSYERQYSSIHVIHQKNQGVGAARNTGLDHATGEVIYFFDPDDALHSEALEKMMTVMLRENVDIVECNSVYYHTNGHLNPANLLTAKPGSNFVEGIYDRKDALHAAIQYKIRVFPWDKLYKSHIWKTLRFPTELIHEDIYVFFDMLDQITKMYVMKESLYMYRKHSGSLTTTVNLKELQDYSIAKSHFDQFVSDHTPDIFSANELEQVHQYTFNHFMFRYLQLPSNLNHEKEIDIWLISTIKELRKTVHLRESALALRSSYYMLLFCPKTLRFLYRRLKNH